MKDRTDSELLDWLADQTIIEGFGLVRRDIHEIASDLLDASLVKAHKKKLREG